MQEKNDSLQRDQQEFLNTIGSLKTKVEQLQKRISEYSEKYTTISLEKEMLDIKYQHSKRTCDILNSEIELWRRRFEDMNTKQEYIRIKHDQLVFKMQNIQDDIQELCEKVVAIQNRRETEKVNNNYLFIVQIVIYFCRRKPL